MKFNFRKIASAAASMAMVGATVGLAAAVSYPAPFVEGGAGDVAVVYGSDLDLPAVTDIASSLNSQITSSSAGSPEGGDFVQLSRASDELNMGDAWTIFGSTVDDDDLSTVLADGVYSNGENNDYDYNQKISLGAPNLTFFEDSDYNDKENTIGFKISAGSYILNYTLDFTEQPQSDVVGGDLDDIESTTLNIFGRDYFIFDADNSTLDLTLLDAANSALVSEGETVTVNTAGKSYEVSIQFISTTEVILVVNGEVTNTLAEKETQKLADGSHIGIKDILARDVAGVVSQVEFSIGSGKIFLDNGSNIELNDDDIDDLKAFITRGTFTSSKETLDKIVIEWKADDEVFLTPEQDLLLPGFEAIKFTMNDFLTPSEENIEIRNNGDDSIELRAPIKDGLAVFDILGANSSGEFTCIGGSVTTAGTACGERLATTVGTNLNINVSSSSNNKDKWFVVSWNSSSDAESYLLEITAGNIEDNNGINETTITNVITGAVECDKDKPGDTCNIGNAQLTISQVRRTGSERSVEINTSGGETFFHNLFTKDGLHIQLPTFGADNGSVLGAINFSDSNKQSGNAGHNWDTYYLMFDEEDKDDDIRAGTAFNLTINDNSDGDLQVSQVNNAGTGGPTGIEIENTNVYEHYMVSDLSSRIKHFTDPDQDYVEITYWGSQAFAEVFIAEAGTTSGTGVAGSLSVKDTALAGSGMQTKNLVLVGGSCVNSATATALGVSSPTCGSAWQSATGVGSGSWLIQTLANPWSSSKVATVVAGYEQSDTVNAATAFRTLSNIDVSTGKKYTGTTGTAATSVVA